MYAILKYILVALVAWIAYYICLNLGGFLFSNMNDSYLLINGFYFSALICVCTAIIVSEIRKRNH